MKKNQIEVSKRIVLLRDNAHEIVAEIVCRDQKAAARITDLLQTYIQIGTIIAIH